MVEIRYGESYEMADLTGRSVAEVREHYKQQLGIPDKAQAKLDGKGISKKHEAETWLGDNDSLTFARKSRRGLFLIGSVLLSFFVTSGVFAYGALTASVSATVTSASADFAVVAAGTAPSWNYWGGAKGTISSQTGVFTVTPEATPAYTGDMVVQVYITNADELIKAYRVLLLNITVTDDAPTTFGPQVLTLENPVAEIELSSYDVVTSGDLDVNVTGGFYVSHFWKAAASGNEAPDLFCKVIQAGP